MERVKNIPYTQEAHKLLHEGTLALAEVEAAGICIDTEYLDKAIRKTTRKLKHLKGELEGTSIAKTWREVYGKKTKLTSNDQLGRVLFDILKMEPPERTEGGNYKTDEAALGEIEDPFVKTWLRVKKLQTALGTYLKGLRRETFDGILRPFYNLNLAQTFRSSSEAINFQNQPVRDHAIMKLIRTAFIARPGNHFVEVDYSGIEVRVAACYHKDPSMITYIEDPSKDMHRDMAMECYLLPQPEVTKLSRYCAKNMFVFPEFYGDYWADCAKHLWNAIRRLELATASGVGMADHLRGKGIRGLGSLDSKAGPQPGTFAHHIQKVERHFWEKRFPVYNQWKLNWFEAYRRKGWFDTLTGFVCQGFMKRNEVINYPVQGSAFHCLLWSVTRMVRLELKRRKMKSLIVGQIHDSMVADVPAAELEDFLHLCKHVMVDLLCRHWKWICVPLDVEAEVAPVGGSWADKTVHNIV